jgi:type II secretory pathway component PulK
MTFSSRLRKIFLTPLGTRMTREERNESRGVALLMVMMGIAIMTAVVSDLNYNETVRYQMCVHTRDSVKAEALAAGGLNWGRLFLVIQGKIQNFITNFAGMGVPLPAYTV